MKIGRFSYPSRPVIFCSWVYSFVLLSQNIIPNVEAALLLCLIFVKKRTSLTINKYYLCFLLGTFLFFIPSYMTGNHSFTVKLLVLIVCSYCVLQHGLINYKTILFFCFLNIFLLSFMLPSLFYSESSGELYFYLARNYIAFIFSFFLIMSYGVIYAYIPFLISLTRWGLISLLVSRNSVLFLSALLAVYLKMFWWDFINYDFSFGIKSDSASARQDIIMIFFGEFLSSPANVFFGMGVDSVKEYIYQRAMIPSDTFENTILQAFSYYGVISIPWLLMAYYFLMKTRVGAFVACFSFFNPLVSSPIFILSVVIGFLCSHKKRRTDCKLFMGCYRK